MSPTCSFAVATWLALVLGPARPANASPKPAGKEDAVKPANGIAVEVRYIDNSVMQLKVAEERLELVTKYGHLQIPINQIRRLELATRVSPDVADKIAAAIDGLGSPDYQVRVRSENELAEYHARAFHALVKASQRSDPELSRRAEALVQKLRDRVPAADLQHREFDVIHTDDCKLTGRLTTDTVKVRTFQFGDQILKLADLREIRPPGSGTNSQQLANAIPAPPNLMEFQGRFGTELVLAVTGAGGPAGRRAVMLPQPNGGAPVQVVQMVAAQPVGSIWGTDVYTLDSHVAAAAVHAGVVQPGQTVAVKVRVIAPPPTFMGSVRNGITTMDYGQFPAGAFEFVRP